MKHASKSLVSVRSNRNNALLLRSPALPELRFSAQTHKSTHGVVAVADVSVARFVSLLAASRGDYKQTSTAKRSVEQLRFRFFSSCRGRWDAKRFARFCGLSCGVFPLFVSSLGRCYKVKRTPAAARRSDSEGTKQTHLTNRAGWS